MSDSTDRIVCPHCQANNVPSDEACSQCGSPLRAEVTPPSPEILPSSAPPSEIPGSQPSPPQPQSPYPPITGGDTQIFIILGFIFAALGLLCPPVFGVASVIMGVIAQNRGNPIGRWVILAGTAVLLLGIGHGIYMLWHHPFPWSPRTGMPR